MRPPGGGQQRDEVAAVTRAFTRQCFLDEATALGIADPAALAEQLLLLYDGAVVSSQGPRDRTAAVRARAMAELVIDSAPRGNVKQHNARWLQLLAKAGEFLDLDGRRVVAPVAWTDLPRSTIHRVIAMLLDVAWVERDARTVHLPSSRFAA